MTRTIPKSVKTGGTRRVLFVPGGVANKAAITKAEALAAENVSCYLTRQGGFEQGGEQQTIADDRYCSTQSFEVPGTKQKTLQVQYVFNLNEPTEDEARLALAEGTKGTVIRFFQKDEDDDTFDTGDWYDAVDIECGEQTVVEGEENAVDKIRQKLFIQSIWEPFKQIVAGP